MKLYTVYGVQLFGILKDSASSQREAIDEFYRGQGNLGPLNILLLLALKKIYTVCKDGFLPCAHQCRKFQAYIQSGGGQEF